MNTGPDAVSQAWARALHAHPDAPDGILYPSRHDPSQRCVALFDRADLAVMAAPPRSFDRAWVMDVLRRYGKALPP